MKKVLQEVRGTKDLLPNDYLLLKYIENTARDISYRFGFVPVDTPIFEFTEVFTKTLGEESDIICKEMYSFYDKSNENITLRPEFTSSIVRLLISKKIPTPIKLFSSGPVFRYERPQKCRQRQFHQVNFEYFGANDVFADLETISLAYQILQELKIAEQITLEINFLGDDEIIANYKESLVSYLEKYKNDLSDDSKRRLISNPLRILDSKNEIDKQIILEAPKISDFYTISSLSIFQKILKGLDDLNIKYIVNDKLVRGLDYYNDLVFEFTTKNLGSQGTVFAGGRYDKLVGNMGGPNIKSVGFAGGVERISTLVNYEAKPDNIIVLIPIGDRAMDFSLILANNLRKEGFNVTCDYSTNIKNSLKRADRIKAKLSIVFGENELIQEKLILKEMSSGQQQEVFISNVVDMLKKYV